MAVLLPLAGSESPRLVVLPGLSGLTTLGVEIAAIAVDMPIGLPDRIEGSGRAAERAVRPLLGPRQSSVFTIPARAAIEATDYASACAALWRARIRRARWQSRRSTSSRRSVNSTIGCGLGRGRPARWSKPIRNWYFDASRANLWPTPRNRPRARMNVGRCFCLPDWRLSGWPESRLVGLDRMISPMPGPAC